MTCQERKAVGWTDIWIDERTGCYTGRLQQIAEEKLFFFVQEKKKQKFIIKTPRHIYLEVFMYARFYIVYLGEIYNG